MKRIILLWICFSPLFACAAGFIVKGSIDGLDTGTISLDYINSAGEDTTIYSPIISGHFTIKGNLSEPEAGRFSLRGDWSWSRTFFLENSVMQLHLVKGRPDIMTFTGSASDQVYEKLKPGLEDFFANTREDKQFRKQAASGHGPVRLTAADTLRALQQEQWIGSIQKSIAENSRNYAALYFIQWLLFKEDDYDRTLSLFNELAPAVRNGIAGKKFTSDLSHLRRALIGEPAPEIAGSDTSGNPIRLTNVKGKVVLLDFWASYCGPCRRENKQIPAIYEKYHSSGFEIISCSLDNDRTAWIKAIEADQMQWLQASDLRGGASASANAYDISDMPANVLIGKDGRIAAKNLHGQALTDAIEGLLRKGK